jgi:hypothetical protein
LDDLRTIVHRDPDSATPTDYGLPPDLLARARTRVAGLAGVLGALSLMALILNATMFREQVDSAVQPQHMLAVGLSLLVIVVARLKRIPDTAALNVGLVYEVFLCWIVSFSAQHAAVVMFDRPPEITWTSMIIVVFPMVVPLPPRRLLVASILGAISSPASLFLLDRMGKYALTIDELVSVSVSPAFAVVLAYFGARMIYAISLDVSRARSLGAYQLESRIGAGGMGEVWRAKHRMLARPAAIKLVHPAVMGGSDHGARETMLKRFEREAQVTASMRSPHTVELFDFGVTEDATFYYVMELLDGFDLDTLVKRFGPVPAERAVHFLLQICHSLGEAHENGLIHRDIKPANVFVCRYGREVDYVKVLDFGLVTTGAASQDPGLTAQKVVGGTPAHMAPEQALGVGAVDARTDLYAVGCVAYWLVTGCLVFASESPMAMIADHARTEPIPPSERTELEIPEGLEHVIMQCLKKDPGARPQTADELAAALEACSMPDTWTQARARAWWGIHGPAGGGIADPIPGRMTSRN